LDHERPYHHGDLKRALIETAQGMLREGEGWQFTLREVARRAGVSHTAPYKHFPDKTALLAEIARQGYLQLHEALVVAIGRMEMSPKAEILAASKAYLSFGRSNASLYRLMFSADLDKAGQEGLSKASLATFEVLLDILTRGQKQGVFRAAPLQGQGAACWALVHGLTMLELDRQLVSEKVGENPSDAAFASLLDGLVV
jgi:AcrR family transcriptional regulator